MCRRKGDAWTIALWFLLGIVLGEGVFALADALNARDAAYARARRRC